MLSPIARDRFRQFDYIFMKRRPKIEGKGSRNQSSPGTNSTTEATSTTAATLTAQSAASFYGEGEAVRQAAPKI